MDQLTALEMSVALSEQVIDSAPLTEDDSVLPTPCAAFAVRDLVEHIGSRIDQLGALADQLVAALAHRRVDRAWLE